MKNKYNWEEIQFFCDIKPRTWGEVEEKFRIPTRSLDSAIKRGKIIFNSKYKNSKLKKYDWNEIQKFCNQKPRTWKEVKGKFGVSLNCISNAIKRKELIFNSKYKDKQHHGLLKQYDWKKIQKDIDSNGLTWRGIKIKYGCSLPSIFKARKRGDIKTLSKSQAMVISNKKHPRKHSQRTKNKISSIRKAYLKKHPDKVPYLLNHHSKGYSYPEKYFIQLFKKEGIKLRPKYQVNLYQLDFADIKNKIDIEIDGNQHRDDKKIVKHDIERTKNLKKKGWRVYRIFWSNYQKKTFQEKQKIIQKLKDFLGQ